MQNRPTVKISPCCCLESQSNHRYFEWAGGRCRIPPPLRSETQTVMVARNIAGCGKRSLSGMRDTAFVTDFRQIPFGIRPKSVPAPRSQNMLQSLSRWSVGNPRIKEPVLPGTAATSEDADKAEDHGPCEMLCEAFARLPQGRDRELKCAVAHRYLRGPNSPPARRGPDAVCFPARRTFPRRLRSTDEWPSKTPERRKDTVNEITGRNTTTARRSSDIVPWGNREVLSRASGGTQRWGWLTYSPIRESLRRPRMAAPAVLLAPRWRLPLQTIGPAACASPYADD
jgi:hypothetical protein